MAKTQEELNQLKQECETLNNKLKELNEDELKEVFGGKINEGVGSNGKTYVKCEPRFYKYPVKENGIVTYQQKPMCSDAISKGLKPECADCEANK